MFTYTYMCVLYTYVESFICMYNDSCIILEIVIFDDIGFFH